MEKILIVPWNLRERDFKFSCSFLLEDLRDPAPQDNNTEPFLLVDIPTGTIEFNRPFYNCVLYCQAFDWSEAEGDHVVIETSI